MSSSESDPTVEKQSLPSPYNNTTLSLTQTLNNGLLTVTDHNHEVEKSQNLNLESSELNDGEADIEIEHIDTGYDSNPQLNGSNITCRGKRTVINLWQKAILEDFFRNGMTTASMQLHSQHSAAAEKTGLDCEVVKVQQHTYMYTLR